MEEEFKNLFDSLHESNPDENGKICIARISNYFADNLPADTLDKYLLITFDQTKGLLAYLEDIVKHGYNKSINSILDLLYTLINNLGLELEKHFPQIINVSLFICNTKSSALSKAKALTNITLMIESKFSIPDDILRNIFRHIHSNIQLEQSSSTVLSGLLIALGKLCRYRCMAVEDVSELPLLMLNGIYPRIKSKTNLEGFFEFFTNYLYNYQLDDIRQLYTILLNNSKYLVNETRRMSGRAALNLIAQHISLFIGAMSCEFKIWDDTLKAWIAKDVSSADFKAGFSAIDAFYKEISKIDSLEIYEYFSYLFMATINNNNVLPKSILRISICGLGYFAEQYKKHMSNEEFFDLFIRLLHHVEQGFILNEDFDLDNLPNYIQTLSFYVKQMDNLRSHHITSIQKLIVLMIRLFPKFEIIDHNLVIDSLIMNISHVQNSKVYNLSEFLKDVIYQGVMWSCSHPLPTDSVKISYKLFMPLWNSLINKSRLDLKNKNILTSIIEVLIKTLLILINKLNLNDVNEESAIKHVSDYIIFVNLTDLYVELLDRVDPEEFTIWTIRYTKTIIQKSMKQPKISGFYKLLYASFKLCNKIDYFNSKRVANKPHVRELFDNICKFIEGMLHHMKQYNDISCMQVLLTTPTNIIATIKFDYAFVLSRVFLMGRNTFDLAELGVDTLERWYDNLPEETMTPILKEILPVLDAYLRTSATNDYTTTSNDQLKKRIKSRRVLIETQPELLSLQKKILCLLTKFNVEMCLEIVNNNVQINEIGFGRDMYLKVTLPYENSNVDIYLEKFLPRLLELVLHSGDYKIRMTSAELLHAVIMVFLGKSVNMASKSSNLDLLLHRIIITLLHLSIDIDMIWLFHELLLQLMRWYSRPEQLENTQIVVLEALMEGISHENNSGIRGISELCLKEFVIYTVQQTTESRIENNKCMEIIIQKFKYFSSHPDPSKGIGAILIVNSIQEQIVKEKIWRDKYIVDIICTIISNLSKYSEEYLDVIKIAVNNISAILQHNPSPFSIDQLESIATFVLENTTSLNSFCRSSCMQIFKEMSPHISKSIFKRHSRDYFNKYLHNLRQEIVADNQHNWLESLICYLDSHIFAFNIYPELESQNQELSIYLDKFLCNIHLSASTLEEEVQWNNLKISFMNRIFELTNCIFHIKYIPEFFTPNVLNLLYDYILKYSFLPFLNFDYNIWSSNLKMLIPNLHERNLLQGLEILVVEYWSQLPSLTSGNINQKHRQFLKGLLLLPSSYLQSINISGQLKMLLDEFLQMKTLSYTTREFCTLKLQVLIQNKTELKTLLDYLCHPDMIEAVNPITSVTNTEFLICEFKEIITDALLMDDSFMCQISISQGDTYNILLCFLKNTRKHADADIILKGVMVIWEKKQFEDLLDIHKLIELVQLLATFKRPINNNTVLTAILKKLKIKRNLSDEETYHSLNEVIYTLGLICDENHSENILHDFKDMKRNNIELFSMPSKIKSTSLLIKTCFEASQMSKAIDILSQALNMYITIKNEYNGDINEILKLFMHELNDQLKILIKLHKEWNWEIYQSKQYSYLQKIQFAECFCILLRHADYVSFEGFYVTIIKDLINDNREHEYTIRSIGFIFVEAMFAKIDTVKIANKNCLITSSAGVDLVKTFLKTLLSVSKEEFVEGEEFRLFQCHAYKATISIFCNTNIRVLGLYNKLFNRKPDDIWGKMINKDLKYTFERKDVVKEKKKIVNIRTKLQNVHNLPYIESQHLFNSTLSEDLCRYDLSHTIVRSQDISAHHINNYGYSSLQVTIAENDINSHECMSTVCGLLQHMEDEGLLSNEAAIVCIQGLRTLLLADDTENNVKIFIARMIENKQDILKQYGQYFIGPIMKIIIDGCVGNEINSFVSDMLIMLLTTWSDVEILPEDKHHSPLLLKFLMYNIYDEVKENLKFSINIFKLAVENFKDINVPYQHIMNLLEGASETNKKVGIHLVNILLANNIAPWESTIKPIAIKLKLHLMSTQKLIYHPCAETIGLAMKFMLQHEEYKSKVGNFESIIIPVLKTLEKNKFAYCVEAIMKNYKEIMQKDLLKITLIHFSSADTNTTKCRYLRIFQNCSDVTKRLPIKDLLTCPNHDIQILTLELILKSIQYHSVPQLLTYVKSIATFTTNNNEICRNIMYDIFIFIFNKFCLSEDDDCAELVSLSKSILLHGLTESGNELESRLLNFWVNNELLPKHIDKRFLYLLEEMYNTSNEDLYLAYCAYILLYHDSNDDKLFDFPLHECNFQIYEATMHKKGQPSATVPIIASALYSQNFELNVIRATQSSLNTQNLYKPSVSGLTQKRNSYSQSESSLVFIEEGFKDPNRITINRKYKQPLKNESDSKKFFMNRAITDKIYREKERLTRIKKLQGEYTMCRSYNIGQWPDIQITSNDLFRPLIALCKLDSQTSKILFVSLFESAWNICCDTDQFVDCSKLAINAIFNQSIYYNPTFIGGLLEIALKYSKSMQFHPNTVSKVCLKSGLMPIGCLLLEEYLTNSIGNAEPPTKRGILAEPDYEILHWIKLAELYKNMEEWDIVHSIFCIKMECPENALKAIEAECQGHFREAQIEYGKLLEFDELMDRKDFYYEAFFKCFAEMSEWSELSAHIEEKMCSYERMWNDDWAIQKLMPFYIPAQTMIPNLQKIRAILTDLSDKMKYPHLKDNFSEELACMGLITDNADLTKHYIDMHVMNFLSSWGSINPLFSSIRERKIINMQSAMEIYVFFKQNEISQESSRTIVNKWSQSKSELFLSVRQAETRYHYRKLLSKFMKNGSTQDVFLKMNSEMVEYALERNNLQVARKYIKKCISNSSRHILYQSKFALKKATDSKFLIRSLKLADSLLKDQEVLNDPNLYMTTSIHITLITDKLQVLISNGENLENNLRNCINCSNRASPLNIEMYGYEVLQNCLSNCEESLKNNETNMKLLAESCYKLSQYFMNIRNESNIILYSFKAMIYNSLNGRLFFPYLLDLESLSTDRKNEFISESEKVPSWMFIRWIPQLLAHINTNKNEVVGPILLRIASEYRSSLLYPYRITKENLKSDDVLPYTKDLCSKLDEFLNSALLDNMITSMQSLVTADVILKLNFPSIKKMFADPKQDYREEIAKMSNQLFHTGCNYHKVDSFKGSQYFHLDNYREKFENIMNDKKMNAVEKIQNLSKLLTFEDSNKLITYSPWLKNFNSSNYDEEVEIPGQYTGDTRPLVKYHIKIAKFDPQIKIFHSNKKPILLTIYGSNTKAYKFLVKYGEDLRQDERIEQLFDIMNGLLKNEWECARRKLGIVTYSVTPLTKNVGIISFIDDTKHLNDLIQHGAGVKIKCNVLQEELSRTYIEWVYKVAPSRSIEFKEAYAIAMKTYSETDVVNNYQALIDKFKPKDALKRAFKLICIDPENFFAYRQQFIKTYGVICIANWILGIGDRHLENILVSTKTGEAVSIDFGIAFGTGTQLLAIPELVPFRLTPQLLNTMQPFCEHGTLQETMIHTLTAFKNRRNVLLLTMKLLIEDWFDIGDAPGDKNWKQDHSLEFAKLKLGNGNPCDITIKEINNRSDDQDLLNKIMQHVKGVNKFRSTKDENLTTEDQVQCLVDQSMDRNLLGRMYCGWQPWI